MTRWSRARLRAAARRILSRGLRAAEPGALVREALRVRGGVLEVAGTRYRLGRGRVLLVAAGKAAGPMARGAERALGGHLTEGIAVGSGPGPPLARTAYRRAGHPRPDLRGVRAALEVERRAASLGPQDLMLVLLSGGASALLPAPVAGVRLGEKAATADLLMRAGATIHELNTVRKHLSRLKGGQLARLAQPARVAGLALSDVVGDDLATIASGPTAPDPTRYLDALDVLRRRGVARRVPAPVRRHLERGARGRTAETPKPGDAMFDRIATSVIGSNRLSLEAAAREARRLGLRPLILTSRLEGEAREVARVLVAQLRECAERGTPAAPPVCLLAGGETTVTVRGKGRGGRNQELAVAAADALAGFPTPAVVAALATDGIDGRSEAAGGIVDDRSASRSRHPLRDYLAANDSEAALRATGDAIVIGATGTNVADVALLLCGSRAGRLRGAARIIR